MKSKKLKLKLLPFDFAISKLDSSSKLPKSVLQSGLYFISKTDTITSVLCPVNNLKTESKIIWSGFKLDGIFDFSEIGILSKIIKPLAESKISILAFSTFETDYIFVEKQNLSKSKKVLQKYFELI
ncbi:MAG: ACT domain-containing protein [Bacteroidetes bacterium]|nr:ACT domain-containing protein [Bacteroidota bacterium]